jgi:hypothetical protein
LAQNDGRFPCPACGKRYRWKPDIAGRKAKCACGTSIDVPQSLDADPDEGAYELLEVAAPVAKAVPAPAVRVAPAPAAGKTLDYGGGRSQKQIEQSDEHRMTHLPRDVYFPVGMLIVGFLALLGWAYHIGEGSIGVVVVFGGFLTVATLIKTVAMIGIAFLIAGWYGVSFGLFWYAVLKLAAMLVATDAALYWVDLAVESAGGLPTGRRAGLYVGLVYTLAAAVVIAIGLRYMFDMDADEVRSIAIPLAVASRMMNFLIITAIEVMLAA